MKRYTLFSDLPILLALACCFLLLGGAASAQLQGSLDSKNADTFSSWTNPTLNIGGWAAAVEDGKPATSVQILIDGNVVGTVAPSTARPDVAAYLGSSAYLNSGWSFSFNAGSLQPGSHTLLALAIDAEGASAPLAFYQYSASINILPPQPPQGSLDTLSATTVAQSGTIVVNGWAGDPQDGSPVKQVQILLDGTSIGNATLGGSRPDVVAVYPKYVNAGWTFTYRPSALFGQHTFTAVAYDKEGLSFPLSVNSQNTFTVLAPDLIEESMAIVGGTQVSGGTVQISDTVTNQGTGSAGTSWTRFYLNTTPVKGGSVLGTRTISTLTAGANSVSAGVSLGLPLNLAGQYYVVACANDTSSVVESNTTNNCTASAPFSIAFSDLVESNVSVVGGSQISGGTIQVSDTVTNQGAGSAGTSWTRFYLNNTPVKGGSVLGTRTINTLASGANSVSASLSLTLPSNLTGSYYILACANDTGSVAESNTANNCTASASFSVVGADLTIAAINTNPAAVLPGATIAITDTTADAFANAGASLTRSYLSKTPTLVKSGLGAGVLLGTRSVPALTAGNTSTGTFNTTIAASTVPGNYYVIACANDTNGILESNGTNNCSATPVIVYATATTVFVDQASATAADVSCGTNAIPCKTITEGLAAAAAGQTVLVKSGTYAEQLSITKNVTLASALKNTAIIQAPAVLVPDPEIYSSQTAPGQQTVLVNITGGATDVSVVNMSVLGPGPTSCGSIGYGIYVAKANASILGNQVLSVRDNPYGGCQNGVAIRFGSRSFGFVGHSGTIGFNTITDYNKGGIVVDGDGTNVKVLSNVITGQKQVGLNGQNGIQISRGALGVVDSNVVSNNLYANPATPLNVSADGILIYDIVGGVTVTNNTVTGNDEGIGVYSDTTTATNVIIKNNAINKNAVLGIHVDANSSGNTIWTNTIQNNGFYDAVDEHPDLTSNDWGTDAPAHNNVIGSGSIHPGTL